MTRRDVLLWIAVVVGPLFWFADLCLSWIATPDAYEKGDTTALRAMTAAAVLAPILGLVVGWTVLRRLPGEDETPDSSIHRARLMSFTAIGVSLLSLLLVVGSAIPKWALSPGAEP